jgi:hypothetical protein
MGWITFTFVFCLQNSQVLKLSFRVRQSKAIHPPCPAPPPRMPKYTCRFAYEDGFIRHLLPRWLSHYIKSWVKHITDNNLLVPEIKPRIHRTFFQNTLNTYILNFYLSRAWIKQGFVFRYTTKHYSYCN